MPRACRANGECVAEREAARDQPHDEQQDGVGRDHEDRGRVLEEIVRTQPHRYPLEAERIGRGGEERYENDPDDDAAAVEGTRQTAACATRSGSSSASALSISSRVLKWCGERRIRPGRLSQMKPPARSAVPADAGS